MKKIILLLIVSILIFDSCHHSPKDKESKNIISPSKLSEILADIHIAEASMAIKYPNPDSITSHYPDYYNSIFQKHKVSKDDFIKTMNYYQRHPEKLEKIYEAVNEILNTKNGKKW